MASPQTPPRKAKKGSNAKALEAADEAMAFALESMDVDGFEVTGSRRRSSRQRKPVHLD